MAAATDGAVTAAVLAVTAVLTAAVLSVVCAAVFESAAVVSTRVGLATDLVVALDLDADLAPAVDLAGPDIALPLGLSGLPPFGVVDELPVWAPPLLLTITPEPTSALDEVDPDVGDVADTPGAEDDPVVPELPVAPVVPTVPVVPAVPVTPVVAVDPVVAPSPAPGVPPGELAEPEDVDELDELDADELAAPPAVSATATP